MYLPWHSCSFFGFEERYLQATFEACQALQKLQGPIGPSSQFEATATRPWKPPVILVRSSRQNTTHVHMTLCLDREFNAMQQVNPQLQTSLDEVSELKPKRICQQQKATVKDKCFKRYKWLKPTLKQNLWNHVGSNFIQVLYLAVWLLKGLTTEILRQDFSLAQLFSCKCLPLWEEKKLANLAHTIPKSSIRCESGSHWNDASERQCKALKETKTYSSQQRSSGYTSAVPCWDLWPLSSAGSKITMRLDSTFLVRIIWTER